MLLREMWDSPYPLKEGDYIIVRKDERKI